MFVLFPVQLFIGSAAECLTLLIVHDKVQQLF